VFRDSLELVRGPRRRGGGLKQNRETKVIHRARSWNEGDNPIRWSTLATSARLRERSDLLSSRPPGSCSETKEYYEVILKESIVFLKTNDKRGTSVFLVKSSLKPCQSNAVITPKVQRGLGSFGTVEEAAVGA